MISTLSPHLIINIKALLHIQILNIPSLVDYLEHSKCIVNAQCE